MTGIEHHLEPFRMGKRRVKRDRSPQRGTRRGPPAEPQARRIIAVFLLVAAVLTAVFMWAINRVADGLIKDP